MPQNTDYAYTVSDNILTGKIVLEQKASPDDNDDDK